MKNNDKLPPTQDPRCGTTAGYHRHKNRNENYCEPCKSAEANYRSGWYIKNQNRLREYSNKWRLENIEKNQEIAKKYYEKLVEENSDKFRQAARKRRAIKLSNKIGTYTENEVLETYGSICHICGIAIDLKAPRTATKGKNWQLGLHIDHVIPLSKGGADNLDNVRPAHAHCNLKKWAN